LYRKEFRPSPTLDRPYAMVAANVVVADSDEEADLLFSSAKVGILNLLKGKRGKMQPPEPDVDRLWSPEEHAGVNRFLKYAFVGSPATVFGKLDAFAQQTKADEVIVTARIYDLAARLRSIELLAETWVSHASLQGVHG
jgi:alkanesulfonate monooxygenase SsuD/methylene tetrahydromethanopterin reductase-like flavin-dependent oxidoreductase (luciferase family)